MSRNSILYSLYLLIILAGVFKNKKSLKSTIPIIYNHSTGLYEVYEDGIIYAMPLELTVSLKIQLKSGETVKMWHHSSISKTERCKVIVIDKNKPEENNEFYADIIPE